MTSIIYTKNTSGAIRKARRRKPKKSYFIALKKYIKYLKSLGLKVDSNGKVKKRYKFKRKTFVAACKAEGVPMVEGYTKPLIELSTFKKYINNNDTFEVSNYLHKSNLICLKICHHHNVSVEDIDLVARAIKKVSNYYLKK